MKWFLDKILSRSVCYKGGGDAGGNDPNLTSGSQTALWQSYAKDWNTYIRDVEPRTEYAFNKALAPDNRITEEMRSGVIQGLSPEKAVKPGVPLQTSILRNKAVSGDVLSKAVIKGGEATKDYRANTLSNILTSKMGAKTSAQSALGNIAKGETENILREYNNDTAIDQVTGQGQSALMGSTATGIYQGFNPQPVTSLTKKGVI